MLKYGYVLKLDILELRFFYWYNSNHHTAKKKQKNERGGEAGGERKQHRIQAERITPVLAPSSAGDK